VEFSYYPASFVAGAMTSSSALAVAALSGSFTEASAAAFRVTRQIRYCNHSIISIIIIVA